MLVATLAFTFTKLISRPPLATCGNALGRVHCCESACSSLCQRLAQSGESMACIRLDGLGHLLQVSCLEVFQARDCHGYFLFTSLGRIFARSAFVRRLQRQFTGFHAM